jgi:hypothetical protein
MAVGAYAALGVLVLIALLAGGLKRFGPAAASAPLHVKALLAPGMIALWPVMLARMFGVRPVEDRG